MVYEVLIRFGTDPKQLQYKGYGDAQPIAENQTEAGRSTNRRTQFKVLKVK
jgi:flagellar motor protein MotB